MALLCKSSRYPEEDRPINQNNSTSPSIYVAYTDLQASKSCFTGSRQAGDVYKHTTIAYDPDTLSVGCGLAGPWYPLNITRLFDPPTNGDMYLSEGCAPIYASNVAQLQSFQAGHGQAASPQFSMPVALKSVDPAWGACKPFPLGVFDPPRTLSSVSAMHPTTKHFATITAVASPGVSLAPLITPTALHTDPTSRDSHVPKNTVDPKATVDPVKSKTEDDPNHSAAASQADPANDQSLSMRPSRTQEPDSHSQQVDPDPDANSRTPQIPKAMTTDNPRGTPAASPSNTEDSTTVDQHSSLGGTTALAVPVDLPVFDPMTFIDPQHRSSRRTSTIDLASKTHVAHTQSTTDVVDAHDTGAGNAIDPAIMSKVIGIDNIFGAAAGASSAVLGGEVDPASKSQSADINIAGTTAGGLATDITNQVHLASTSRPADLSSDFNPQETARPYIAATTGASSLKSKESIETVGSDRSLNGGFTTTTQATQNVQYESGSTLHGLSASSSGPGASSLSNSDRLSSSADDSSHRSPGESETPRIGRTNDIMSTSNSHGVLVSHPIGISEAMMTSAVGIGPQSTDLTNSNIRATARLTSRASATDTAGSTTSSPAVFLGQGTRLLPCSAASAFMWLVASALCTNSWIW